MAQSPELTEFYRAYNSWLESGAPEDSLYSIFSRSSGLCYNLDIFCREEDKLYSKLKQELKNQFEKASLHVDFPFNKTHIEYIVEVESALCHLNALRIRWVKKHIDMS